MQGRKVVYRQKIIEIKKINNIFISKANTFVALFRIVLKNSYDIEQSRTDWCVCVCVCGANDKKIKHGKYDELENVLLEWFKSPLEFSQIHLLNGTI